jgi:hypothetical protein
MKRRNFLVKLGMVITDFLDVGSLYAHPHNRILSQQMGKSDFQVDFITINIAGVKDANVILKGL